MDDHFALMRGRLITEATLQVVIERMHSTENTCIIDVEPSMMDVGGESDCDERSVQCRICHDEDSVRQMEAPCSCTGSLKFVHPRCVLRWCQEKGNNTCEICLKQYRGYILHRRIVLHMRDSIIRANNEMQQRNASRRISEENFTEQDPVSNRKLQSSVVPLEVFLGGLLVIIIFIAAPALQEFYQKQETNDSAGTDSNV